MVAAAVVAAAAPAAAAGVGGGERPAEKEREGVRGRGGLTGLQSDQVWPAINPTDLQPKRQGWLSLIHS